MFSSRVKKISLSGLSRGRHHWKTDEKWMEKAKEFARKCLNLSKP
jgi:hypothetical protein